MNPKDLISAENIKTDISKHPLDWAMVSLFLASACFCGGSKFMSILNEAQVEALKNTIIHKEAKADFFEKENKLLKDQVTSQGADITALKQTIARTDAATAVDEGQNSQPPNLAFVPFKLSFDLTGSKNRLGFDLFPAEAARNLKHARFIRLKLLNGYEPAATVKLLDRFRLCLGRNSFDQRCVSLANYDLGEENPTSYEHLIEIPLSAFVGADLEQVKKINFEFLETQGQQAVIVTALEIK